MRNAQSGTNAAIFVAIMTLLIVIYILFLPPEFREELLAGETGTGGDIGVSDDINRSLLIEKPGTIDFVASDYRNHDMPAFRLFSTENGEVLKEQSAVYVKNSAFEKRFATIEFNTDVNHNDFLISFNVDESDGRLILILNGQEIFNGEIGKGSPKPITLPSDIIEDKNTLEIQVSPAGWAVWKANTYKLSNLKITADYLDKSAANSQHTFFVSASEKNNLERTTIFFFPRCDTTEVGRLFVDVNDVRIYSSVADCGVINNQPINPNHIFEGENTISFSTDKGSYLIDNMKIRNYIKEPVYPIYYFEMSNDFFSVVDDDDEDKSRMKSPYEAVLKIKFVNRDTKRGEILINGRPISFNTDDIEYSRVLETYRETDTSVGYLLPGSNALELIPRTSLDIVEFKIVVEDYDD